MLLSFIENVRVVCFLELYIVGGRVIELLIWFWDVELCFNVFKKFFLVFNYIIREDM